MRIPGLKTLRKSARWLKSRFIPGALILGYHRVSEERLDPYSICVTPPHFAEQLEVLSRYARVIPLRALVQGLQENKIPPRSVVLTFDDGYADRLYQVRPLLEKYQVPATVFVVAGSLGCQFWWDELAGLLLSQPVNPGMLRLSIRGTSLEWILNRSSMPQKGRRDSISPQGLLNELYELILPLPLEEQQRILAEIKTWSGVAPKDTLTHTALRTEEIQNLLQDGLIELGSHSVTHPMLEKLPIEQQRFEIEQSKVILEAISGRPVVSFSYPNGSFLESTEVLVRQAGYTCACTSQNDLVWRGSNPYRLPRFWIPDWDGLSFSKFLNLWINH